VPCGPINSLDDVFADPQVVHRGMRQQVDHPTAGPLSLAGTPFKLSVTPGSVRIGPPLLGQHTDEVLGELGLSASDIEALRERGAI